jgi:hypothetical protein
MSQARLAVPNSLQNKSDAPYLNSLGALITGAVTQRFGYAPASASIRQGRRRTQPQTEAMPGLEVSSASVNLLTSVCRKTGYGG